MTNIFISYRRDDSADISGRIYDRLVHYYGAKTVFKDVNSLRGGQRFPAKLENAITEETIMLVVIGQRWLPMTLERHNDPFDFGRVEIEIALRQHATIIPVLVQGAAMPTRNDLPPSIADVANLHAVNVRSDPDFMHDVDTVRQAISLFYRAPQRSFSWVAAVSGILLAVILGVIFIPKFISKSDGTTAAVPTSTVVPTAIAKLPCSIDATGNYPDDLISPFKPVGNQFPPAVTVSGINGEVIGVIGSGNTLSAVANARINFDQTNKTCTKINRSGSVQGITDFVNGTEDGNRYQIAVTDFSITEVRSLGMYVSKLTDHQIGVIPYVMIVNKTLYATIKDLSTFNIHAIYQGSITNWNQLGGPDEKITAFWPGTANTRASNWPTNQDDLNSLSGALVSFKRNIMRNEKASDQTIIDSGNGQSQVVGDVNTTDYGIGFVSLESLDYYKQTQNILNVIPITIDGYAPTADTIRASKYTFWDIAHAYTRKDLDTTTPLGKATNALLSGLTSSIGVQADIKNLSWISLDDVAPSDRDCHNSIDLCSLRSSS